MAKLFVVVIAVVVGIVSGCSDMTPGALCKTAEGYEGECARNGAVCCELGMFSGACTEFDAACIGYFMPGGTSCARPDGESGVCDDETGKCVGMVIQPVDPVPIPDSEQLAETSVECIDQSKPLYDAASGECMACPVETPFWTHGRCTGCNSGAPVPYEGGCFACVEHYPDSPYWSATNGRCEPCPDGAPFWSEGRCTPCWLDDPVFVPLAGDDVTIADANLVLSHRHNKMPAWTIREAIGVCITCADKYGQTDPDAFFFGDRCVSCRDGSALWHAVACGVDTVPAEARTVQTTKVVPCIPPTSRSAGCIVVSGECAVPKPSGTACRDTESIAGDTQAGVCDGQGFCDVGTTCTSPECVAACDALWVRYKASFLVNTECSLGHRCVRDVRVPSSTTPARPIFVSNIAPAPNTPCEWLQAKMFIPGAAEDERLYVRCSDPVCLENGRCAIQRVSAMCAQPNTSGTRRRYCDPQIGKCVEQRSDAYQTPTREDPRQLRESHAARVLSVLSLDNGAADTNMTSEADPGPSRGCVELADGDANPCTGEWAVMSAAFTQRRRSRDSAVGDACPLGTCQRGVDYEQTKRLVCRRAGREDDQVLLGPQSYGLPWSENTHATKHPVFISNAVWGALDTFVSLDVINADSGIATMLVAKQPNSTMSGMCIVSVIVRCASGNMVSRDTFITRDNLVTWLNLTGLPSRACNARSVSVNVTCESRVFDAIVLRGSRFCHNDSACPGYDYEYVSDSYADAAADADANKTFCVDHRCVRGVRAKNVTRAFVLAAYKMRYDSVNMWNAVHAACFSGGCAGGRDVVTDRSGVLERVAAGLTLGDPACDACGSILARQSRNIFRDSCSSAGHDHCHILAPKDDACYTGRSSCHLGACHHETVHCERRPDPANRCITSVCAASRPGTCVTIPVVPASVLDSGCTVCIPDAAGTSAVEMPVPRFARCGPADTMVCDGAGSCIPPP